MNILHKIMERKYRERIHQIEKEIVNGDECDEKFSRLDDKYIPINPGQRTTRYYQTHLNFYQGVRQ